MYSQGDIFANGNSFRTGQGVAGMMIYGESIVAEAKWCKWLGPISPGALG